MTSPPVHAGATVVYGAITAFYMAVQNLLADRASHTVGTAALAATWLVTAW